LVHDFDQTEDGALFIVMEWLEGRVLSEVIQRDRALDLPRAVRLATQIAEGLEAAHRANVIHRDVKPQNIMVLDAGDDIKLMDFGIARLRDAGPSMTRAGTMMGTPDYMAPEQIEGQDITEKTDMYSFGIVLYEMLTGMVPFRASTQAAVLTKQLQEPPVPPSRLRPEIPHDLEAIVLKALEKDPTKRERDMAAIVRALRETSRHLGDLSPDTFSGGAATMVVDHPTAAFPDAPGPTVQVARTFVAPRTPSPHDPEPGVTVMGSEIPQEGPAPAPPGRPASHLGKGLAIAGAIAAVLVVAVATVVYERPGSGDGAAGPGSSTGLCDRPGRQPGDRAVEATRAGQPAGAGHSTEAQARPRGQGHAGPSEARGIGGSSGAPGDAGPEADPAATRRREARAGSREPGCASRAAGRSPAQSRAAARERSRSQYRRDGRGGPQWRCDLARDRAGRHAT
jgi:hypothetical protein